MNIKKLNLPKTPGVYIFKDKSNAILYVGKATNLKSRVASYFKKNLAFSRPIEFAVEKIAKIDFEKTDTVLEAYILEQNLIKKHQPKYNILSKDDKSFCYVVLIGGDFPRFEIVRQTDLESNNNQLQANSPKLQANSPKLLTTHYLPDDKIGSLLTRPICYANYSGRLLTIFGPYTSRKNIEIVLRILQKIFPFHRSKKPTEKGCLDFQIGLCPGPYAGKISKKEYRKNIHAVEMILKGKKKSLIKKLEKEMKKASKEKNFETALEKRNQLFALRHIQDLALINDNFDHNLCPNCLKNKDDQASCQLQATSYKLECRIEAYDISNISGKFSVGSMVVFENSSGEIQPNKNEYRKFKIKKDGKPDDVLMMKEVLQRRMKNDWKKPSLIILDGGKGHFNMADKLLKKMKIEIPLLAVAKGPKRKKLDLVYDEKIFSNEFLEKIIYDKKLLTQIRDEAHRFAITYHRKLREGKIGK